YRSPDYETAAGVIPAVGTLTGTPTVQGTHDIYFNLFLPSGHAPVGGWPVVIGGHGSGGNKEGGNTPIRIAAKLAQHGMATITINAVGHGGGPLSTLSGRSSTTCPARSRSRTRSSGSSGRASPAPRRPTLRTCARRPSPACRRSGCSCPSPRGT